MYTTYNKIFSVGGIMAKEHPEKDSIYLYIFFLATLAKYPKGFRLHRISLVCQPLF